MPPRDYTDWFNSVYPELSAQGAWLRGGELNTLPKQAWEQRPFRVLWTRLSTYYDTGYSFTHQLLYQLSASLPGVYPDLCTLPPRADLERFRQDGVPWLLGSQSKRGPFDFDLIAFSNSIQQELINLPSFLARSGIPLSKRERLARPDVPLILLGGANALYTTLLWHGDSPVDAIFVGEDDGAIQRLLTLVRDGRAAGRSKAEILAELESIDGLIQPDRPRRTKKAFIWNLNQAAHLEQAPVYHLPDAAGSAHLQISEGCPCFCSFCAESWDRKPYRERQASVLKERALALKAQMGLEEIELYSFNFNMHSGFYQVLWDLVPHFRRVGLKSQRFDLLANDPQMVEFQHAIEKSSLTCGLEGISPRLRAYLHKNLETDDLHRSLHAIFSSKARALKVFLIATGLEEAQDFEALSDLLGHMAEIRRELGAGTRVLFSMTPLVRFPWTPLEYEDAPQPQVYADIIERVARRVRNHGFEFRESADLEEYWVSQVLVRADDPRIWQALVEAIEETGFVYFSEVTRRFQEVFSARLGAQGLDPTGLLRGHDFEQGEQKPWALVETGVKRPFLWEELLRARSYKEIDYCLGRAWTRAKCFKCGGCPSKEHVRDIVLAKQPRNYELADFVARIQAARRSERSIELELWVEAAARGLPRRLLGVALGRALMQAEPGLVPFYAGFEASEQGGDGLRPCWSHGAERLRLRLQAPGLDLLDGLLADPARRARVDAELGGWARLAEAQAPLSSAFAAQAGRGTAVATVPQTTLRWRLRSPYAFAPGAFLEREALPHTLRRLGPGHYGYEWSQKAKKRDVLKALESRLQEGFSEVLIEPGRRFDLEAFLRGAFDLPSPSRWVEIEACAERSAPTGH